MKGFSKVVFCDDGSSTAVACGACGKHACFCKRDTAAAATTVQSSSRRLFEGLTLALSATGEHQGQLQKIIEQNGGVVSRSVHRRVDLLVATDAAIKRDTQAVRKARNKFSIPLVLPSFVHTSVADGMRCEASAHTPTMTGRCNRTEAKNRGVTDAPEVAPGAVPFPWRRAICRQLEAERGQQRRRDLRSHVLAEYLVAVAAHGGEETLAWWREHREEQRKLFRRRLRRARRAGRIATDGKLVRVVAKTTAPACQ